MSQEKTQPTPEPIEGFLGSVEPSLRREEGFAIAHLMARVTGEAGTMWGPSIVGYGQYHYVSPGGREGDWLRVGFAPRKAAHSLYGLKDLEAGARLLPRLGRYTEGAGCVYVKKLADIDLDVLRQLVAIAYVRAE